MKPLSPLYDANNTVTVLVLLSLPSLIAASTSTGLALLTGLSSWAVLLICTGILRLVTPVLRRQPLLISAGSAFTLCVVAALLGTVVTLLNLTLQLFRYEATLIAGVWLPLIASNAFIYMHLLGVWERADSSVISTALWRGALYCSVLLVLAVVREFLGSGMVFSNLHLLNPEWSEAGVVVIDYPRLKLFAMPAGGLLVVSMMLALINLIKSQQRPAPDLRRPAENKRVRVTGRIR